MSQARRSVLRNFLSLKQGEGAPAAQLFLLFFVSSIGSCLGLSTGESLFIRHFGIAQVPLMFLLTSVVVTLVSLWIGQLGSSRTLSFLIRTVYLLFLSLLAVSILVMFLFPDWPWIYVFVFVAAYTSLANLKGLAVKLSEEIFDIRQMKRLFAPISAGAVLGMAVGGFGTGFFLRWFHDSRYLVLIWFVCAALSFALSFRILKRFVIPAPASGETGPFFSRFFSGFTHLGESRLLVGVSLLSFLTAFLVLHYDFLYMFAVRKVYHDPEEITRIFGLVRGFSTLATFALQIAVTPVLIRLLGITQTLLFLPGVFFASFLLLLSHFGMANVFVGRYGYYIAKEAFFFPSFQPLLNALSEKIRKQAVFFVNNAVASIGSITGGIFLIAVVKTGVLTPKISAGVSVFFAAVFFVLAVYLRKVYLKELVQNIQEQSPKQLDLIEALKKARSGSAPELLLPFLKRDDLESILFALEFLKDHRTPEVRREIAALIERASDPRIHKSAFEFFGEECDPALFEHGDAFLKHEAAVAYLDYLRRVQGNQNISNEDRAKITAILTKGRASENRLVQIQSQAWLYEPADEISRREIRAFFDDMFARGNREEITFALSLFPRCRDDFFVYLVISRVDQFAGENKPFTEDFDLYLKVLLGMKHPGAFDLVLLLIRRHPRLIHPTLRALAVVEKEPSRRMAERLLSVYERESGANHSEKQTEVLLRLLFALPEIPEREHPRLLKILLEKKLPTGLALSLTGELAKNPNPLSETERERIETLIHEELARAGSDLLSAEDFSAWDAGFSGIYRDEMTRSLEKSVPLIGNLFVLLFPGEKLAPAIAGLLSEDRRTRSSALESLENVVPPRLFETYLAVLERDLEKLRKNEVRNAGLRVPEHVVERLLSDESEWERALGLHLASRLQLNVSEAHLKPVFGEHPLFPELRSAYPQKS